MWPHRMECCELLCGLMECVATMAEDNSLDDAYAEPANFLEIDVTDPQTNGMSKGL